MPADHTSGFESDDRKAHRGEACLALVVGYPRPRRGEPGSLVGTPTGVRENSELTTEFAALAFLVALAATLGCSELLVLGTSRLGFKLGLAAGLVGLLTALGADSPEIASAMSAILSGAHDVGVGVVLGSNLFNLAALLGLPGLIQGRLPVRRIV